MTHAIHATLVLLKPLLLAKTLAIRAIRATLALQAKLITLYYYNSSGRKGLFHKYW